MREEDRSECDGNEVRGESKSERKWHKFHMMPNEKRDGLFTSKSFSFPPKLNENSHKRFQVEKRIVGEFVCE